jgi:hypothetical protein
MRACKPGPQPNLLDGEIHRLSYSAEPFTDQHLVCPLRIHCSKPVLKRRPVAADFYFSSASIPLSRSRSFIALGNCATNSRASRSLMIILRYFDTHSVARSVDSLRAILFSLALLFPLDLATNSLEFRLLRCDGLEFGTLDVRALDNVIAGLPVTQSGFLNHNP